MREYPAYGRTIASHIVRGQKPVALAVLLSSRWDYYNHVPKVCIKPEEWRIGRFEFGFLRGLHAVAIVGDESSNLQLAELVLELMRVGPALLWIYDAVGGKVYDGEFASDVSRWAFGIVVEAGERERLPFSLFKTAELVMSASQARAAELWQREFERVEQRGDLEASVRFQLREHETKDRVRELFATPWQAPSDARAA
jgi:hypothetical protein